MAVATPRGNGQPVQACSHCGQPVRFMRQFGQWRHLDQAWSRDCADQTTTHTARRAL